MAKETYIATVQIIIRPGVVDCQDGACDWMIGLLSDNPEVLDWGYLKKKGHWMYPEKITVCDNYEEGDAIK
jgi:hypothetical protein